MPICKAGLNFQSGHALRHGPPCGDVLMRSVEITKHVIQLQNDAQDGGMMTLQCWFSSQRACRKSDTEADSERSVERWSGGAEIKRS